MERMEPRLEEVMRCARKLITERRGGDFTLLPESPLSDHLDSFHWVLLVSQLEKALKVKFKQTDLANPADWATCASITALLEKVFKRASLAKG